MVRSNLIFLRLLAIILIMNSHLGNLYPLQKLTFGGHLGNSIFYFISGIGLSLSFQREPMPFLFWLKKRFVKILVPLIICVGLINIGNIRGFALDIFKHIILYDKLEAFLPVLWILYFLFFLINKLTLEGLKKIFFYLSLISLFLFVYKIDVVGSMSRNLQTSGVFYPLNALCCFVLGVFLAKNDCTALRKKGKHFVLVRSFIVFCVAQGIHHSFMLMDFNLTFVNFYVNFVTVISLYFVFTSIDFSRFDKFLPFMYDMSLASLSIYIIHFEIIKIVERSLIPFPYNIICVYLYSFIFAYSVSKFSNFISMSILFRVQNKI